MPAVWFRIRHCTQSCASKHLPGPQRLMLTCGYTSSCDTDCSNPSQPSKAVMQVSAAHAAPQRAVHCSEQRSPSDWPSVSQAAAGQTGSMHSATSTAAPQVSVPAGSPPVAWQQHGALSRALQQQSHSPDRVRLPWCPSCCIQEVAMPSCAAHIHICCCAH